MLTFEPEGHIYRWKGNPVPSVTQIMAAVGMVPYYPADQGALTLGRWVHETTALFDQGELDESALHPVLAGYLAGWKQFRKDWTPARTTIMDIKSGTSVPWSVGIQTSLYEILLREYVWLKDFILIERPMYSPLGFAGTPDRVYLVDQKLDLIDRLAVRLSEDGKYSLHHCRRRKDREIARAAIAVYFDSLNHCQ